MFENIVGNNKIKEFLKTAIQTKNVSHSYMFLGKSGVGKKLFAKDFAKNVLCLNVGETEKCNSCIKFDASSNPDYTEIAPEGKSIKVEQIRKMQEKIAEKPIISSKKVYIIDEADCMSEEAQNCLLKTLEEPPQYAIIILIVSNESKILPTIKSRCLIVKFEKLTDDEIKQIMPNLDSEYIKLLEGSMENAEDFEKRKEQYRALENIVNILSNGSLVQLFTECDLLYDSKDDIISILEYLNIILFEKKYINCVEVVEKTKRKILANNNYDMCIDYLLMNIWKESKTIIH